MSEKLTLEILVQNFTDLGVRPGDVLMVHSSYKSFGGVEGGPQTVIDALLSILGSEGTLIMPTFNLSFCKGEPWDISNTPSEMGIISELVRNDARSRRVFHPIHSYAVLGKLTQELTSCRYKSSFERASILGKLHDLNGKILIIGLPYNKSITFYHYVEEMVGVKYRYHKTFTGNVTDETGRTYQDGFEMYVRELSMELDYTKMGDMMEEEPIVRSKTIGESLVKLMNAVDVYRVIARILTNYPDPGMFYRILSLDEQAKH